MNNCGVLEDLVSHEESQRSLEVLVLVGAGTRDKRDRRPPPTPHIWRVITVLSHHSLVYHGTINETVSVQASRQLVFR
jgi:hypothetical protein